MTTSEVITAIRDGVMMIAAGIASYVAIVGLNTWRKQLTGTTEYELAREVLRAVYKLRDRVDMLRTHRRSFAEENKIDLEKAFQNQPRVNDQEFKLILQGEVLRLRWPAVQEALSEFELASIEAEVLFGPDVREKLDYLKEFVKQLANSCEVYYSFVERKELDKAEKIGKFIFGSWEWNDEHTLLTFNKPPKLSIDEVTKALIPYLKKK